jgi:hypothetical protein
MDAGVNGQDLLSTEVFPEGSSVYMSSLQRDATYEEVLHFVHGYGIQLAAPGMQNAIEAAMESAIDNDHYHPLFDLPVEDHDEEYLAMGLECYFGLWAHDPSGDGFCGDQEYAFIDRESMSGGDPELFNIIKGFMGELWNYVARLPTDFSGGFYLFRQPSLNYTHRSKYLRDVGLTGDQSISVYGNEYVNEVTGNTGDDLFQGFEGDDFFNGSDGHDRAIFIGDRDEYVVIPSYATEDSSLQVLDIQPERDGTDHLFEVEELEFNGVLYQVSELLEVLHDVSIPEEYRLYSPYPNPFNPTTKVAYDIPKDGKIELVIFDINGRLVRVLDISNIRAGHHEVEWDAKDNSGNGVSAGVYFVRFTSETYYDTKKILLLK